MKVQIFSDLHLETYPNYPKITPYCDIIILVGDISLINTLFIDFIKYCSKNWKYVIFVKGNHECYYHSIETIDKIIIDTFKNNNLMNVHFLNNQSLIIDNYEFIGSVFWSNSDKNVKYYINDFNKINNFTYDKYIKKHLEDKEYLLKKLNEKTEYKKIFITHFPPIFDKKLENIKYKNQSKTLTNYFHNSLSIETLNLTNYWIFGHTHDYCNCLINNTTLISNPLGYKCEKEPKLKFNLSGLFIL
jgi:predicted phosphohydrolase